MKRQVKQKNSANGSIRIIAGQWRGRKLPVLDADGLRPTTDRTKETVFNWLAPYIVNRICLDAFAGSGSLGFEALSRHAQQVTFVELNAAASQQLASNLATLKVDAKQSRVVTGDVMAYLGQCSQGFDLVFIDPPFNQGLVEPLVKALSESTLLTTDALVYIESELDNANYWVPPQWHCLKEKQTKQLCYRLYQTQ